MVGLYYCSRWTFRLKKGIVDPAKYSEALAAGFVNLIDLRLMGYVTKLAVQTENLPIKNDANAVKVKLKMGKQISKNRTVEKLSKAY